MDTVQRYFRVTPHDMAYVKFIVESYEGLAVLSTVDSAKGIMEWMIPHDLVEEIEELIESLREEVVLIPCDREGRDAEPHEVRCHELSDRPTGR